MTKFTARRLGSTWRVTGQIGGLREQFAQLLDGQRVGQPPPLLVGAHPHADVGVAALVAAAGAGDRPSGHARVSPNGQRLGQRERSATGSSAQVSVAGGDVDAGAVGVHGDVRHLVRRRRSPG